MELDIIGKDAKNLLYIENLFKNIMEKYNYEYIKTPNLEDRQVLSLLLGDDYIDSNLRNSHMVGIVRNYLNQTLDLKTNPLKLWYNGSVFSPHDLIESYKIGFDVLGSYSPTIDAEGVNLVINFYRLLGLNEFKLIINTNGDPDHFDKIKEYLEELEIDYEIDEDLYLEENHFTDFTFRIITTISDLEEQIVIASGGRYNDLISLIGGNDTPGFGCSININNLLTVLNYDGYIMNEDTKEVYIKASEEANIPYGLKLLEMLRMNGFTAEFDHNNNSEEDKDYKFVINVDNDSVASSALTIRNSRTLEEFEIKEEYIINFLDEKVSGENEEDIY